MQQRSAPAISPSDADRCCANSGGGYQYRLCPLGEELTEACVSAATRGFGCCHADADGRPLLEQFQKTPLPFARDSRLHLGNGTTITLNSTFVSEGTLPAGSTWQMNPIVK